MYQESMASMMRYLPVFYSLTLLCLAASLQAADKRPNILLCISDDQSYADTGAAHNRVIRTPAFDRVAREGIHFFNAFCNAPTCGPSRSAILTGQPIWRERTQGIGVITTEEALAMGATGPILRSTGYAWDLRRAMPYLAYDQVDFDIVVGTYGDTFDRYAIRLNEIRESMRIVEQCLELIPDGPYRAEDRKVTPPPRARIDESMEALIHHFKIFTEGFKVPPGEVYTAVESPRGELGCYLVSDGGPKPYRMHIRGPSFVNLQTLPHLMEGGLIADGVAVVSSVDPIMGEVDR